MCLKLSRAKLRKGGSGSLSLYWRWSDFCVCRFASHYDPSWFVTPSLISCSISTFEASRKFWIFSWCFFIRPLTQESSWRGERSLWTFGTELWYGRFQSLTHNHSIFMWVLAWYGMESRLLLGLQRGNKRRHVFHVELVLSPYPCRQPEKEV